MAMHQLTFEQKLPTELDTLWEFISSPMNLAKITPPSMDFRVTKPLMSDYIYPGMFIAYKVSPLWGISMEWVTEITQVEEKKYFVDEQRKGPYKIWHHEHHLIPQDDGILMRDIISYQVPFGPLGDLLNAMMIQKKIEGIFKFREEKLRIIFPW
ncbi:MAG: SRPBCC family protein [Saprospiraceae bacterium]|nr:SRPBCC family protein [Saprospiraceae bacterium]